VCGRYRLSRREQFIAEHFDSIPGDDDWSPRYNIAPTQPVPIIRQHPKEPRRELSLVRWGLIPSWSKDASSAARMINARAETAATLPAFRDALKARRCIVPADGFYEWQKTGKTKQPFCFEVRDGELSVSLAYGSDGKIRAATGSRAARSSPCERAGEQRRER
jgi:putative SOS response-associated peptidase YedK